MIDQVEVEYHDQIGVAHYEKEQIINHDKVKKSFELLRKFRDHIVEDEGESP
jgi:hypothetical protein